jgi:hypothetical protein
MFTRGGDNLKNTAIFIGGENVPEAEKLMKKSVWGVFRRRPGFGNAGSQRF